MSHAGHGAGDGGAGRDAEDQEAGAGGGGAGVAKRGNVMFTVNANTVNANMFTVNVFTATISELSKHDSPDVLANVMRAKGVLFRKSSWQRRPGLHMGGGARGRGKPAGAQDTRAHARAQLRRDAPASAGKCLGGAR